MPVYLSPYVGAGVRSDMFRPRAKTVEYSSIDLRPDCTQPHGYALLHTPDAQHDPSLYLLGWDKHDPLSRRVEQHVGHVVGRSFDGSNRTLGELTGDLLMRPPSGRGGWNPLQPALRHGARGRYYEVHLGGDIYFELPVIAGGTDVSDTFTRANENPISGNWTNAGVCTAFKIISNQLAAAGGSNENYCFWNANTFADDQYSQVQFVTLSASIGLTVRGSGASKDYYALQRYNGTVDTSGVDLLKYVSGTYTSLSTAELTWAANDYGRLEVSGTSLAYYMDASVPPTTLRRSATDSTHTSGKPGVYGFNPGVQTAYDNWSGGDIASVSTIRITQSSARW